ncbi:unnamed protein product [Rotaria socialis]
MILSIKFVEKKKTSRSSEWWKFVRVEIEFRSPVPFFTPTPISENIFLTIPIPTSENTRSLPTSALPMSMTQPVSIVAPITIVVLGLSSFLAFGFVVAYRCVLMLAKTLLSEL